MDTNNNIGASAFSGSRFMTLMKSDFKINGGHYLKLAIAAIGCFVGLAVLVCIPAMKDLHGVSEYNPVSNSFILGARSVYWSMLLIWGLCIMSLGVSVFGSLTFSSLGSKRGRISTFVLPASLSEKFALRTLVYFVFGLLTLIVGFMIAILIAQLSFGGFDVIWSKIPTHIESTEDVLIIVFVGLLLLVTNALYTLGSALWPRLSWLKTWIVMTVLQWILGIMLMVGLFNDQNFFRFLDSVFNNGTSTLSIFIALECVVIVACWIGAWFRFRNTQIVQMFMRK